MADADGPELDDFAGDGDISGLASVVEVGPREEIAAICGRVDAAPTFAVVIHAPRGNRQLATELGIRRLQRHVEDAGKVAAIATRSGTLASRARNAGIPVGRQPAHIRWDAGGRTTVRILGRTLVTPAVGRYAQGAIILALVLLFAGAAATVAPSAKVIAYPPTEEVTAVVTITASPDRTTVNPATLAVPARKVSAEQVITLAVKTTGRALVPAKSATATVAITNTTAREVTVPAGTALLGGPGGTVFELGADASVPPGNTVTRGVSAHDPGPQGNLPAGAINRWKDEALAGLTVTNPEASSGGTSEPQLAVSAADIVAINALAEDLGRSETVRRLILAARPHDAVFLGTAEATTLPGEPSAPAGAPADLLTLDVKVTVTALAVLAGTLEDVARQVLAASHPDGEFIPGSVTATETGARQMNPDDGTIRTDVAIRGLFARKVTRGELREAVKGQSSSAAKSTLARRYGIDDATVDVSPGWAPWLPRFGFRIDVELRSRLPAQTSTAEGTPVNGSAPASPTPSGSPAARP